MKWRIESMKEPYRTEWEAHPIKDTIEEALEYGAGLLRNYVSLNRIAIRLTKVDVE